MNHIELKRQGEAIQQFFLSLPVDPEGTVVEMDGRALIRLAPIAVGMNGEPEGEWTKAKNARRRFLIEQEIEGTLTSEEARELALLQRQMGQHLDRVAPLPMEGTRRLYDELLAKAEAAHKG